MLGPRNPLPKTDAFRRILLDHHERYPRWAVEDVYKLIHQAAMGSEHAVKNTLAVHDWMERELASMGAGPTEPLMDPIRPDGRIVRIHLRPYIARSGSAFALVEAFIATANNFKGSIKDLDFYWATARQMAVDGDLPFDPQKMDKFFAKAHKANSEAHEHSAVYEKLYCPAYRVIWKELLPNLRLAG
jgi:hypothetical protein